MTTITAPDRATLIDQYVYRNAIEMWMETLLKEVLDPAIIPDDVINLDVMCTELALEQWTLLWGDSEADDPDTEADAAERSRKVYLRLLLATARGTSSIIEYVEWYVDPKGPGPKARWQNAPEAQ